MSRRFLTRRVRLLGALAVLCAADPSAGDRVFLRNGQVLEGVVLDGETGALRLDLGVGVMEIPRAAVLRVERGDAQAVQARWRDRFWDHPAFLPESLRDLARRFLELDGARSASLRAAGRRAARDRRLRLLPAREERLREEADALRQALVREGAPGSESFRGAAYNELVREFNALGARHETLREERRRAEREDGEDRGIQAGYLAALDGLGRRVREWEEENPGRDPEERRALDLMKARLAEWNREAPALDIPHEWVAGQVIVTVRINDRHPARMLLDTGATVVTLSTGLARRIGLPPSPPGQGVSVRLADGRQVEAVPVRLASLSVGAARAAEVEALVLPDSPAPGVEGLLGMSFLRDFLLRYEPAAGRVELVPLGLRAAPAEEGEGNGARPPPPMPIRE